MRKVNKDAALLIFIAIFVISFPSLLQADEITLKTIMPNMSSAAGKWTSITPVLIGYYPNPHQHIPPTFPTENGPVMARNMPNTIPAVAKEVLVYIEIVQPQGGSGNIVHYFVYTTESGTFYQHTFLMYDIRGGFSTTFWLPVTSDKKIYIACDKHVDTTPHPYPGPYFTGNIYVVGYR